MSDDSVSRRRFLRATGGVTSAVLIAGCSGGQDGTPTETEPSDGEDGGDGDGDDGMDGGDGGTSTDDGDGGDGMDGGDEPQSGGTMNLINATMTSLDPVAVGDTASGIVANQIYEPLFEYPNGEPEAEPRLAANYDVSDDFTTYTVELADARFQNDGGELTAADVIYSWERLAAAENTARSYFILDSLNIAYETNDEGAYEPGTLAIEAVDDKTVEFTLERPFHSTLEMLAYGNFAIHPENIVGDVPGYDGQIDQETLATSESYGTGPFVLDHWESGEEAEVVRYNGYREEDRPYLDAINWAIIEDDEAEYTYSVNENADMLEIPTGQYDPGKVNVENEEGDKAFGTYGPLDSGSASGEEVNYMRVPEISTRYLAFDIPNTPRAVRQAAAYAINRREISDSLFKGRQPPGWHFTPPSIFPGGAEAYDEHVQNEYPYGIEETLIDEARQVMEDAGYGEDNPYDLTINAYNAQVYVDIGENLRDKLQAAYINVSVEPTEFATIIQRGQEGSLQAYTLGWIADWPAPDNFLQLLAPEFSDVQELGQQALSYINWNRSDSEYATQAQEAWETISDNLEPSDEAEQARRDAYLQIEEANWQECGFINLTHGLGERFWYDHLHVEPHGGMGGSRQRHGETWKEQ
jgi:peptide/nickel transport system substrate-binding protein